MPPKSAYEPRIAERVDCKRKLSFSHAKTSPG